MKELFILTETNDGTYYCTVVINQYRRCSEYLRTEIESMAKLEGFPIIDLQTNVNDLINKYSEVQ